MADVEEVLRASDNNVFGDVWDRKDQVIVPGRVEILPAENDNDTAILRIYKGDYIVARVFLKKDQADLAVKLLNNNIQCAHCECPDAHEVVG